MDHVQVAQLKELSTIIRGRHKQRMELEQAGEYLYLRLAYIGDGTLNLPQQGAFITEASLADDERSYISQPGDIIVGLAGADVKIYLVSSSDRPMYVSENLAIIRSSNDDYIYSYLKTPDGRRTFSSRAKALQKGTVIPHISISELQSIQIPIVSVCDLEAVWKFLA